MIPARRLTSRRSSRSGNVLVIFAFFVFAAIAGAALVIDVGFARLTQHEMQTAADSAALEGLRYRDDLPAAWRPNGTTPPQLPPALINGCGPQPGTPYDPTTAPWQSWCDCARRYAASTTTTLTFDDDLNPADGDPLQLGAGPVVQIHSDGDVGDPQMNAAGLVELPADAPPVYKPNLQSNPSNSTNGDMVAGQYGFNPSYDPSAPLDENSVYARRDFIPDDPAGTVPETGFLARLRRSHEDFSTEPGSASNGPALTLLFGRGSMIARSSDDPTQLTAASGLVVRATSIAAAGSVTLPGTGGTIQVGHVLSAGPVDTANRIMGVAPFGLTATYWNSLINPAGTAHGTDMPTVNPQTGTITSTLPTAGGTTTNPNAIEAGVVGANQTTLVTIGQTYAPAGSTVPLGLSPALYAYVPIYDTIGTTPRTIVAFAFIKWTYTTGTLSLTVPWNTAQAKPSDRIASENATTSLAAQFPAALLQAPNAQTLIQQMFTENQGLNGTLLAPVLASRYFGPTAPP